MILQSAVVGSVGRSLGRFFKCGEGARVRLSESQCVFVVLPPDASVCPIRDYFNLFVLKKSDSIPSYKQALTL